MKLLGECEINIVHMWKMIKNKKKKFHLLFLVLIFLLFIMAVYYYALSNEKKLKNEYQNNIVTKTIMVDGVARRYAIYIPDNLKNLSIPIVFELHGGGIYIEDMIGESGHKTPYKLWTDLAKKEKFIVVYPEGLNGVYGKPTWNDCRKDCSVNSGANDVLFIKTLIEKISTEYNVDSKRIYVSGTSNGGFMALRLAVELSDRIAAVAAVSASMPAISKCKPPRNPISVLFMNGTNDNHMPYTGGYISNPPNVKHGSAQSTEDAVKFWVNFDHTEKKPIRYVYPDLDNTDGGTVEKFDYKNGDKKTEVVLYKINGGGHSAPSIKEKYSFVFEKYFNKQNHDIEMTTEIWNFFKNKTLN